MQVYISWGVCVCTCTTTSFLLGSGQVLESHPWISRAQGQESVLMLILVWGEGSCLLVELWEQQSLQLQISHDVMELTRQFLSFNGYQCFHVFFFFHIILQPLSAPLCPSVLPDAAQILQSSHFRLSLVAFCIYRADEADYTFHTLITPLYWTEKNLLTKTHSILSLPFLPHPLLCSCLRISQPWPQMLKIIYKPSMLKQQMNISTWILAH